MNRTLKNISGLVLGLALSLMFSATVFAEENTTTNTQKTAIENTKQLIKERAEAVKQNIENERESAKNKAEVLRETKKNELDALREGKKNEIEALKENKKNEIEALKAERKIEFQKIKGEKRDEKRKDLESRLGKIAGKAVERLNESISKLEGVSKRIEERVAVLKAAEKNTTTAEGFIADAKAKIQLAKDGIAKLPAVQTDSMTAEKLSEGLVQLKIALKEIGLNLKAARDDLSKAIGNVKGLGPIITPATDKTETGTTATTTTP